MTHEQTHPDELLTRAQDVPAVNGRCNFRNPSFQWRVLFVAGALALPGSLAGAMASLLFGDFIICAVVGGLVGLAVGAAMEAWPQSSHHVLREYAENASRRT